MNKIKMTLCGIFLLLSLLPVSCGQAQTKNKGQEYAGEKGEQIDKLISAYAEGGNFNGSVLVAQKGEILFKKGFGFANMEWDIPNQADTKHRIASITKQFTAMLIVKLAAEGKLDLQENISTFLPDYPQEKADRIRIHHLLTHTSGIPDYGGFPNYRDFERKRHRPHEIVALFADLDLEFSPGERYQYSNSGYVLLGLIIEKITGKAYAQVLNEKILQPLNMKDTGYDSQWLILKNRANGYYKIWGKYRNTNYIDMSLPYAAGSMYSTVEDLFLWDKALRNTDFLPEKYREMIFAKHIPATRGRHYGYGWFMGEMPQGSSQKYVKTISHGGGLDGFRTQITRMPEDSAVILLLNNTESARLYEMTAAIIGILHKQPYDFPDKSVAQTLTKIMETEGIEPANAFYQKVKGAKGYYLKEEEFIVAGYDFLQANHAPEAAAIFKLSLDAFPQSFNVYDSYGEALMVLGKKAEAIKNYQKSIELNPDNENGKKMLKELKGEK